MRQFIIHNSPLKTIMRFVVSILLAIAIVFPAQGAVGTQSSPQTKSDEDISGSLRHFVQEFYDWYIPKTSDPNNGRTSNLVLKLRGSTLTSQLARGLKEDSEAQAKANEIVGLDFDPFTNSQDPCERYEVGKITRKEETYWIEVYAICEGKKSEKPNVLAELARINRQWQFVNFHYTNFLNGHSQDSDLLSALKSLREERRKSSK